MAKNTCFHIKLFSVFCLFLLVFDCKFGELRVTLNEKGETVFCLLDVCKALGIGNPSNVKERIDFGDLHTIEVTTKGKNQYAEYTRTTTMTYIGEPNLYRCIFQSRKEEAKEFQDWVFNVVLPQIRKTGGFIPVSAKDDEKTLSTRIVK